MKIGMYPRYGPGDNVSSPDWLAEWARVVEGAGVESIWVAEHLVLPAEFDSPYPYSATGKIKFSPDVPFPEVLHTLTFIAAITSTINLGTAIAILAGHNPVEYAMRCATLDALSKGRLLLGIGLGWMKEEFDAVGAPWDHRGARTDEYVAVMRTLWEQQPATFDGRFVQFKPITISPRPARAGGPQVIVAGSTPAAARRAGRIGDGYYPAAITPEDLEARLGEMRRSAEEHGRNPEAIEVTVRPAGLSSTGSFDIDLVRAYARLGVSRVVIGADEAGGTAPEDSARLAERYRQEVLAKL
jgi:probable F420-dependent oxidoreductase